ncbi:MAG: hypothetical protein ACKOB6_03405, partial [Candidatus Kapaibacterium sp.]
MAKTRPTLFQQLQEESAASTSVAPDWRASGRIRIAIFVVTPIICAVFYPSLSHVVFGTSQSVLLSKGQVWQQETVVAESTFPIRKEKSQLERDIDEARSAVP